MLDTKECTLMFYFASDNPLAISIVSQRLEKACPEPARNFLRAWSDLLDQSGVPVCGDRAVRSADARSGGRRVHAAEPGIDVA